MLVVVVCVAKTAKIVPKRRNFAFFCQNIWIYEKKAVLLQPIIRTTMGTD